MEWVTKKYDSSPKSWILGAVTGVHFKQIASVVCLQSVFKVGTSSTN